MSPTYSNIFCGSNDNNVVHVQNNSSTAQQQGKIRKIPSVPGPQFGAQFQSWIPVQSTSTSGEITLVEFWNDASGNKQQGEDDLCLCVDHYNEGEVLKGRSGSAVQNRHWVRQPDNTISDPNNANLIWHLQPDNTVMLIDSSAGRPSDGIIWQIQPTNDYPGSRPPRRISFRTEGLEGKTITFTIE